MNGIVPHTQIRIQIQQQAPQEIQSHTKQTVKRRSISSAGAGQVSRVASHTKQTVKRRSIPPHQNLALPRIDTHNPTRNAHSTATPKQRHQIL